MLDTDQTPDLLSEAIAQLQALQKYRVDIERALVYADHSHSFDDVAAKVLKGDLDVHVYEDALVIAELVQLPNYRIYNVFIAAGDLQTLIKVQREPGGRFVQEAKKRRAKAITMTGRKGWLRALSKEGWEQKLVTLSKELDYG